MQEDGWGYRSILSFVPIFFLLRRVVIQYTGVSDQSEVPQASTTRLLQRRGVLTDRSISSAKPGEKSYKLADGNGLFLLVNPNGSKLWRWKFRVAGKEKLMALGSYPAVGLAEARGQRDVAHGMLSRDLDPMEHRKAAKRARQVSLENSFEAVARKWWVDWSSARSDSHTAYVLRRLEADVFPAIGARPISEIDAPELVKMAKAIEARGALDIAKRALQTTGQIFRYAIGHGIATRNPATDIRPADVLKTRKKQNYARVDQRELPDLLRQIDAYQGSAVTRLAVKLLVLTFVRTKELIGAQWCEFDLDRGEWRIPANRMKMKVEHIVPLAPQSVQLLRVLKLISGDRLLLFPGERNHQKPMSNNTILGALARMGYKHRMTGHGFRGLASTILHEQGFDHQHIELQLAHAERNAVSAAYNHALYLVQRRQLMEEWANFIDRATSEQSALGGSQK